MFYESPQGTLKCVYLLLSQVTGEKSWQEDESVDHSQQLGPGVDVMITIFCDFRQFSAKKLAFFSKTNVVIKFLHNLALFRVKKRKFFRNFWQKYFKNIKIGPCSIVKCKKYSYLLIFEI
jgi:hypothetical protein